MSIPRKLHVIWIGDESLRPDAWIRTWVQKHPEWSVRIWNNDDLATRGWVNARHMRTLASERQWAGVADLMRWEILYDEGGVAFDADSVCLAPIPDDMLENAAFSCWENEIDRPGLITTVCMGAVPGNPFVGQIVLELQAEESLAGTQPWISTGPKRLTNAYHAYRYFDLTIYPSHFFIPRHFMGTAYRGGGRVYADQRWGTTTRAYGRSEAPVPEWSVARADGTATPLTVGIVTYNRAGYLREAIESALAQDHPAFEVLVVDDGSTDGTEALVAQFDDPRLRYLRKDHTGLPDTRNRALAEARGEYICWLDSDDALMPGALSRYERAIRDWPEAAVFYGDLVQVDAAGRVQRRLPSTNLGSSRDLFAMLVVRNRFPNPGTLLRVDLAREIGGYDLAMERCEDYDMWLRIAARREMFRHVPQDVVRYRWHGGNASADARSLKTCELAILRKLLAEHSLEDLCSDLHWHLPEFAAYAAITRIGLLFESRGDDDAAFEWLSEAKRRGIALGLTDSGTQSAASREPEAALPA